MGSSYKLGSISGYLAKPSGSGPWPALIVIQEWWGLDLQTQSIADRFAAIGYLAFAPDLYHGELAKLGDGQKAAALVQKYAAGAPAELEKSTMMLKICLNATARWAVWDFASAGACRWRWGSAGRWMPSAPSTAAGCSNSSTNWALSRVPCWACR